MESDGSGACLVDSSVLLDVITEDPQWGRWSESALADEARRGRLVINAVVYAEVSVRYTRIEELDEVLPPERFLRAVIPYPAAFMAAKCHLEYRRRGGVKTTTLPDLFIGAHAAVGKLRLLTRDARQYRTYFPTVELICPAGGPRE